MSNRITCSTCGQEYENTSNGNEHECPGDLSDHDERIASLEERVRILEERLGIEGEP